MLVRKQNEERQQRSHCAISFSAFRRMFARIENFRVGEGKRNADVPFTHMIFLRMRMRSVENFSAAQTVK